MQIGDWRFGYDCGYDEDKTGEGRRLSDIILFITSQLQAEGNQGQHSFPPFTTIDDPHQIRIRQLSDELNEYP